MFRISTSRPPVHTEESLQALFSGGVTFEVLFVMLRLGEANLINESEIQLGSVVVGDVATSLLLLKAPKCKVGAKEAEFSDPIMS